MRKPYGRVIPAMVTPFDSGGAVDDGRARELARHLVDLGCDGIVVAGSTGEAPVLDDGEKERLLAAVVEAVGERVFVWAGTGTYDTHHTVELSRRAEAAGADGLLVVAPYYNKPPQEGLYRHFRAVAEAVSLPILLYNIPGRTGVNMTPATVARLAEIPNIVGIKESTGNLDQASEIRALTPQDFLIYSGDDSLTLPLLAVGAHGVISVAAHLVGDRLQAMIAAFDRGDVAGARAIHLELMPLFKGLFVTTNPIPVKAALRLHGWDVGGLRLPLVPPAPAEEETLRRILGALGLLREAASIS